VLVRAVDRVALRERHCAVGPAFRSCSRAEQRAVEARVERADAVAIRMNILMR
jgi:hypothetical protein